MENKHKVYAYLPKDLSVNIACNVQYTHFFGTLLCNHHCFCAMHTFYNISTPLYVHFKRLLLILMCAFIYAMFVYSFLLFAFSLLGYFCCNTLHVYIHINK